MATDPEWRSVAAGKPGWEGQIEVRRDCGQVLRGGLQIVYPDLFDCEVDTAEEECEFWFVTADGSRYALDHFEDWRPYQEAQ